MTRDWTNLRSRINIVHVSSIKHELVEKAGEWICKLWLRIDILSNFGNECNLFLARTFISYKFSCKKNFYFIWWIKKFYIFCNKVHFLLFIFPKTRLLFHNFRPGREERKSLSTGLFFARLINTSPPRVILAFDLQHREVSLPSDLRKIQLPSITISRFFQQRRFSGISGIEGHWGSSINSFALSLSTNIRRAKSVFYSTEWV